MATHPANPEAAADYGGPVYAGVDVGGTNTKIGLVDDAGRSLAYESIPTQQADGPQAAMRRAVATLDQLAERIGRDRAGIAHLGLATPGPLDLERGMLLDPGNLPAWHETPIRAILAEAAGRDVLYANDANAAAYGEFWSGAGERHDSLVMVTLGTGVGGGVIVGGRLIEGAHGAGGEIGHIIINSSDDAPLNSLGIRGTLEGYCGSYGVVGRAEAALADHFVESSLRHCLAEGEHLTPLLVANAAEAGDELATKVVMDTARYLAIGIVTCVHTLDPQAVILGGAMTFGGAGHPLGERFLQEVRTQAAARMIKSLAPRVAIEFAKLSGNAGYIGAAGLARAAAAP
ncbi:MAG: ROK family protein [Planctomycetota bacterium]